MDTRENSWARLLLVLIFAATLMSIFNPNKKGKYEQLVGDKYRIIDTQTGEVYQLYGTESGLSEWILLPNTKISKHTRDYNAIRKEISADPFN
jgi:hypothetical protein